MPETKTVTLIKPVQRGEATIASVILREPSAGDMRGLKLTEMMQMDVATMIRLIPRVSDPGLAPDEVAAMGGADLMELSTTVIGFFFTEEQIQAEAQLLK